VDAWILLRNIEVNGERNRLLYVLKSRGMAHSNQIREFLLTHRGVRLREVYLGPGGVLTRAGHTEAAVDLARLAGLQTAGVLCEIMNADGSMARRPQLEEFAGLHGLRIGSIADLIRYRLATEKTVTRTFDRDVDTEFGRFRMLGYRDTITRLPHFALVRGAVDDGAPVLTRVHVRDTLSDVLHIARADGALSLAAALRHVAAAQRGVVVVLSDADEARMALDRLDRLGVPREGDAARL